MNKSMTSGDNDKRDQCGHSLASKQSKQDAL